jgi:small subunit ribosomal protein S21
MLIVKIEGKTNIDSALKRLKSKYIKSGIQKDLFSKKEYKKKSVIRRDKLNRAKHIQQKKPRED